MHQINLIRICFDIFTGNCQFLGSLYLNKLEEQSDLADKVCTAYSTCTKPVFDLKVCAMLLEMIMSYSWLMDNMGAEDP